MLKSYEKTFALLQKIFDALIVVFSWTLSFYIRFNIIPGGEVGLEFTFFKVSIFLVFITIYFFAKYGLYQSQRLSTRIDEIYKIFKANLFSTVLFVVLLYFFSEKRLSRSVLLFYFLSSTFFLLITRLSVRNFLRSLRRKGKNLRHILLIGHGPAIEQYVKTIQNFKDSGISFKGWIDSNQLSKKYNISEHDLSLNQARNSLEIDNIVISYCGEESVKIDQILRNYHNDIVPIQILPDLTYAFVGYNITEFAGIPILTVNQPNFSHIDTTTKRVFDTLFSGFGLIFISPILFLIAIAIKISSPGPIFYGQERVGLDGKKFKMWKFRSMKISNDQNPGWTVKDDPRKTRLGSILRSTSLDELPQLWNVLIGEMSLVGPRPEQTYYVEKFRNEIPAYMLRHKMKAGLTGWAQVNGWRGDTSLHKRIECDIYYIRNWSIGLDFKIIFLTFWKGFINKNAY